MTHKKHNEAYCRISYVKVLKIKFFLMNHKVFWSETRLITSQNISDLLLHLQLLWFQGHHPVCEVASSGQFDHVQHQQALFYLQSSSHQLVCMQLHDKYNSGQKQRMSKIG